MACMRPGTSSRRAAMKKNPLISMAATSMNITELVIDRSSRPSPGTGIGGKSTTLWTRNCSIGSIAAIGLLLSPQTSRSSRVVLVIVGDHRGHAGLGFRPRAQP